ncbi:MAG: methionyl-tRNA formyltransferase, partial [Lentisphaeria bacterium]|nr:methionyl-tRNA formyltransferase [Lentisphaeria bacterium]
MNQPARLRVYYLASGALGIPSLETMAASAWVELCGVATQPERPAGRRRQLQATPVGARARELGLPCRAVPQVNDPAFLDELTALRPDVVVVASFGQLLRQRLLDLAPQGCLNLHASLLPRHRGASPIQAAILAGDASTGISFMRIDAGLDTGPLYRQIATAIGPAESAGELEGRLARLAADHLEEVLRDIVGGRLVAVPQPAAGVTLARKIPKEAGRIDWRLAADGIARQVRAYNPWPRSDTLIPAARGAARRLQVMAAEAVEQTCHAAPGT